jgi:hypothetical protein
MPGLKIIMASTNPPVASSSRFVPTMQPVGGQPSIAPFLDGLSHGLLDEHRVGENGDHYWHDTTRISTFLSRTPKPRLVAPTIFLVLGRPAGNRSSKSTTTNRLRGAPSGRNDKAAALTLGRGR